MKLTLKVVKSWEHSGFRVWIGNEIHPEDEEKRLFISRYLEKSPISLKRLVILENQLDPTVRYYKKDDSKTEHRDFSPLHFLAELSQQIPNMWEKTTRYYGVYSARTRGAKRRDARFKAYLENNFELLDVPDLDKKRPSTYWARWIKKVYEIDPLKCPKCGSEMKIKAFIHDSKEIARICLSLGIADWRAPPAIKPTGVRIDYSSEFQQ